MKMPKNIQDMILAHVKDTLGYAEAKDKESFLIGVSVALNKAASIYYDQKIELLEKEVKGYKAIYEDRENDLRTISRIIKTYSEE